MKRRLFPVLLLVAALLLTVIAPAEAPTDAACESCGVLAWTDPLFETNHAACEGCGLRNCDPMSARKAHTFCSGCGLRKCDSEYNEDEHMKCAGCRELLCVSGRNHTHCEGCKRYVCREADHYGDYLHLYNAYGRWTCLDYPEEPEPEQESEPESKPESKPTPKPACKDGYCSDPTGHSYCEVCERCTENEHYYRCPVSVTQDSDEKCGMHHTDYCYRNDTTRPECNVCFTCALNTKSHNPNQKIKCSMPDCTVEAFPCGLSLNSLDRVLSKCEKDGCTNYLCFDHRDDCTHSSVQP